MKVHEVGGTRTGGDASHAEHEAGTYKPVFVGDAKTELDELLTRYPSKMAALLPALWIVQHERGWVSDDAMAEVAQLLELTPAYVKGVVTFYTMYHQHPVGKYFIQVCTTSPCGACGAEKVVQCAPQAHAVWRVRRDVRRRQVHGDRGRVPRRLRLRDAGDGQRRIHRVGDAGARPADPQPVPVMGFPHAPHAKETPVLSQHFGDPAARTVAGWKKRGGYAALETGARHDAGRDRERGEGIGSARTRRRRIPHGHEVVVHETGRWQAALPVRQRRRIRARHVQGPRDHALDAARAHRGLGDRLATRSAPRRATSTFGASSPSPCR